MTAQAGGAILSPAELLAQRQALRQQLRQRRRALSPAQQQQAARQLAIQFDRAGLLRPGLRIAVYLAMPGELNLQALIERARARHCQLYVPHIVNARRRQMQFVLLPPDAPLQRHRWGMPQLRQPGRVISIRQLDLVLAPTVAFDAGGHRLGMGAGFYDRHLACLHQHRWRRPRLIGVALALQQVAQVPVLAHDVPLPWVMTERGLLRCHSSAS